MLVTGGDDRKARVFAFKSRDYNEIAKQIEIEGPQAAITGVDINQSNSRIVASSKDHHAYIWDLKTKTLLDKLSFKYKPDLRNNMVMRDCLFHSDGSVFTLAVEPR